LQLATLIAAALIALAAAIFTTPALPQSPQTPAELRAQLQGERARNARRIDQIQAEAPAVIDAVNRQQATIDTHNGQMPGPDASESAVNAYNARAARLNAEMTTLRVRAEQLTEEWERLEQRQAEIDRLLRQCVQPPVACSSNEDCTCSGRCAAIWDGQRTRTGICQPAEA